MKSFCWFTKAGELQKPLSYLSCRLDGGKYLTSPVFVAQHLVGEHLQTNPNLHKTTHNSPTILSAIE